MVNGNEDHLKVEKKETEFNEFMDCLVSGLFFVLIYYQIYFNTKQIVCVDTPEWSMIRMAWQAEVF